MSNILQRALTGAVFVATLIGATLFGQWSFALLFMLITAMGVWEFYTLVAKSGITPQKLYGTLLSLVFFGINAGIALKILSLHCLLLLVPFVFILFIRELSLKKEKPFESIGLTLLGLCYVAVPFSLLNHLLVITGEYLPELLLGIYFILWTNDTGAYLFGRKFGKRKLWERISPGKTWEGSVGGGICSLVVAGIIAQFYTELSLIDWLSIASILIVIGTLGDLTESLLKRSLNVKDSGNLLPGHGGILDRFDSLILSVPFLFTYLFLTH
jgi:phosphatidate cytidylyltransferase